MKLNWKLLAITMLVGAAYTLSGCALECLDQFDCAEQSKKDGGKRYTCVANKCQVMIIPETGGGDGSTGGGDGSMGGGDGSMGGGDGSMGGGDGTTGGGDADAGAGGGTATGGGTGTGGGDADAGTGGGTATGGGTGTDAGDTDAGMDMDAGMTTDAGMDMDAGTDAGMPATCSVCTDPGCGTNANVSTCAAGETLCTTQATQGTAGVFLTQRACSTPAAAQTALASNPPECADFDTAPTATVCTYACDGVNFPDCNHPPQAMPDAGVWDGGQ